MKRHFIHTGFFALCAATIFSFLIPTARGAQPPADQLLPSETLAMLTVKDFDDATNNFWKSSMGRLWNDEAMTATREKFNARWTNEITGPLEKEFKFKVPEILELLRGQFTFALTKPAEEGKSFGIVLIADTEDKSETLKTRLAELQKNWTAGDNKLKTEKIRDVEFTTYQFTHAAFQKFMRTVTGKGGDAEPDAEAEQTKRNILVGQSQSLLIVGTQARDIEKILARQSGSGAPPIAEQPAFQANYNSLFRDAGIYGWLDFKPVFDQWIKPSTPAQTAQPGGMPNLSMEKVLPALGLAELKSVALRVAAGPEGFDSTVFLTVPEASRQGILKILAPPAKDSSPPPFVPADAIKFTRVRIDFSQAWSVVESTLMKIDPSVAGIVQLMLSAAGKTEQNPDFDLKKSLLESIGDDFITYEKAPKDGVAKGLTLIGAKNPEQLVAGLKALARMLPEPIGGTPLKEREFLGRKIYTMGIPGAPEGGGMQIAATGSYIVITGDNAILEEYLRSADTPPKPLRDLPGLADAAQKAGGMNTGWFSCENQAESMRVAIEEAKKNPDKEPSDPSKLTIGFNFGGQEKIASEWIDAQSLPPFDRISKYFYYQLMTAAATPEGISFRMTAPTPPALK